MILNKIFFNQMEDQIRMPTKKEKPEFRHQRYYKITMRQQNILKKMEFTDIQKTHIFQLFSHVGLTFDKFKANNHRGSRIIEGLERENQQNQFYQCNQCSYRCQNVKQLAGHKKRHRNKGGVKNLKRMKKIEELEETYEARDERSDRKWENILNDQMIEEIFEEDEYSQQQHFRCIS